MEKRIDFTYQARYHQLGELNTKTKHLIFALHGYGQQSKYFIRKFRSLVEYGICIIAPEGLNRFYLEGYSGRVGATWMTKEDRETDILNYLRYLNAIYAQLTTHSVKVTILGFSQGAATASRWVSSNKLVFQQLILWAGIFPPDLNVKDSSMILRDKKIIYVYGKKDEFITADRLNEMQNISNQLDVSPTILTFNGGHTVDEQLLKQLFVYNSG